MWLPLYRFAHNGFSRHKRCAFYSNSSIAITDSSHPYTSFYAKLLIMETSVKTNPNRFETKPTNGSGAYPEHTAQFQTWDEAKSFIQDILPVIAMTIVCYKNNEIVKEYNFQIRSNA